MRGGRRTTTQRGYGAAWQRLCKRARALYGDVCHVCGQSIPHGEWTLDHLDPLGTAGVHLPTIDRVRPAHRSCNSRRGMRPLGRPQSRPW